MQCPFLFLGYDLVPKGKCLELSQQKHSNWQTHCAVLASPVWQRLSIQPANIPEWWLSEDMCRVSAKCLPVSLSTWWHLAGTQWTLSRRLQSGITRQALIGIGSTWKITKLAHKYCRVPSNICHNNRWLWQVATILYF